MVGVGARHSLPPRLVLAPARRRPSAHRRFTLAPVPAVDRRRAGGRHGRGRRGTRHRCHPSAARPVRRRRRAAPAPSAGTVHRRRRHRGDPCLPPPPGRDPRGRAGDRRRRRQPDTPRRRDLAHGRDRTAGTRNDLLRHDSNRGPGAARNTGLAAVTTALVAFVDTDVALPGGVAAAAPRPLRRRPCCAGRATGGRRARRVVVGALRAAAQPARPGHAEPGSPPARGSATCPPPRCCAARRRARGRRLRSGAALGRGCRPGLAAGSGRPSMQVRTGERGAPPARRSFVALLRQRFGYGRSAAALARRHPGALAPVRMSGWSVLAWLLLVARHPLPALAVAGGTTVALQRKLTDVPRQRSAWLAGLGHLAAGRQLAQATVRAWWPWRRGCRLPSPCPAAGGGWRSCRPGWSTPRSVRCSRCWMRRW
ncbi:MAG: glycosyltransferase [Acidimicrobiaceae bacterium]|nr:glycosyltransferase [Acidimicrobiaceae bacterium]